MKKSMLAMMCAVSLALAPTAGSDRAKEEAEAAKKAAEKAAQATKEAAEKAAQAATTAAKDAAVALGGQQMWLSVWERNPRAIAFYGKCGFRLVGTKDFWVGSDRQTDHVMVAELRE